MRKNIVVLGSTGSIGTQALSVIAAHPDRFETLALSANRSARLLCEQAAATRARYVGLADTAAAQELRNLLPPGVRLEAGKDANCALAALPEADIVLICIGGIEGLPALLCALRAGKTVALANKESIVCGNPLVQEALQTYGGRIVPVDSEHSALFQCLQNGTQSEVASLILTASGGPFREYTEEQLARVTPEQALNHPVWHMGRKITVDSATLFNKGLEVIEASFLFGFPNTHISVLIHPQSIVHSMVEYVDGSVIAQMSAPDMRLAIQYALSYPERLDRQIERLSLAKIGGLTFFSADDHPAIRLARAALAGGDVLPVVYNAANEIAVELFLEHRIGFLDIRRAVEHALEFAPNAFVRSLNDVMQIDTETRKQVAALFRVN